MLTELEACVFGIDVSVQVFLVVLGFACLSPWTFEGSSAYVCLVRMLADLSTDQASPLRPVRFFGGLPLCVFVFACW